MSAIDGPMNGETQARFFAWLRKQYPNANSDVLIRMAQGYPMRGWPSVTALLARFYRDDASTSAPPGAV